MTIALFAGGCLLIGLVACSRFLFLAPMRLGWVMYLANVVWESMAKRLEVNRFQLEIVAAMAGLAALSASGTSLTVVATLTITLLTLELADRLWERRILTTAYTCLDPIGIAPDTAGKTQSLAKGYPSPSTHPELTLNLEGPFITRWPKYSLGWLWIGRLTQIELLIGNHTLVPTQTVVQAELIAPSAWLYRGEACQSRGPIAPGTVSRIHWLLNPSALTGNGTIEIIVKWGSFARNFRILFEGCISGEGLRIETVRLKRYPGGRRSAFAWRGDMDLYDTSTMQSVEGLETTLKLARRYCFPQTLCLSTRLSLDENSARQWAAHYGVDRGASEIPYFIKWLLEFVDLRHHCAYPVVSSKRYVIELGNHGHLHYGTDTAAAPENHWMPKARMGAAKYPWIGTDITSFGEQRDNALEAQQWCERFLGFSPRTWAKPGRCNDQDTARAIEASGCEVLSGSNIRAKDNVLFQPPPHHPEPTAAVELTTRYPPDPQHIHHVAMLLFWLHRSHRLAIPMILMCHQHLRLFMGSACAKFTEYLLRYVLTNFHGDFYVDTVFGIGKYWREVISPKTSRLSINYNSTQVTLTNKSDIDLQDLPIDILLSGGKRATLLASVGAGRSHSLDLQPDLL